MRKRAFVPSTPSPLEDRVVLSHGPHFINGAAVLTFRAYSKAASQIERAFVRFATHGLNYNRLDADLARAVSPIPYNRRDGLVGTLMDEVATMQDNINAGTPQSVIGALQSSEADLNDFVQSEVASGAVVIR